MRYELPELPSWKLLGSPLCRAEDEIARLDERLGRSPVREGWSSRMHFADAAACLWLAGELVHLEDLVLHDAGMDVRLPTHEIIRAREVLQARRRLAAAAPGTTEAVDLAGVNAGAGQGRAAASPQASEPLSDDQQGDQQDDQQGDPLAAEFAALEAALARTRSRLDAALGAPDPEQAGFVYDPDYDGDARLAAWRATLASVAHEPPLLAAALAHEAWGTLQPMQHKDWIGPLLLADGLRLAGKTRHHLLGIHVALRSVPREQRRARAPASRLLAFLKAAQNAAEFGMKEHDRWLLARQGLERKLAGRRSTSRLPALIDLMMSRPVVSAALVAAELSVSPRAAQSLLAELGVREVTGRGRYRAWAIF